MIYKIYSITINLDTKIMLITYDQNGTEEAALINFDSLLLDIRMDYVHRLLSEYLESKQQ